MPNKTAHWLCMGVSELASPRSSIGAKVRSSRVRPHGPLLPYGSYLVALLLPEDLFICAKFLFFAAMEAKYGAH
jgi:hypothetical protein